MLIASLIVLGWFICSVIALILLGQIDRESDRSDDELLLAVLFAGPISFLVLLAILIFGLPSVMITESNNFKWIIRLARCYHNIGFKGNKQQE